MTITRHATYERGRLRPRGTLPFQKRIRLQLTRILPDNPVTRTWGIFRVPKRTAAILIDDDSLLDS